MMRSSTLLCEKRAAVSQRLGCFVAWVWPGQRSTRSAAPPASRKKPRRRGKHPARGSVFVCFVTIVLVVICKLVCILVIIALSLHRGGLSVSRKDTLLSR